MKLVTAAFVWFMLLYAVDALWFDGRYVAAAGQAIEQACALDW